MSYYKKPIVNILDDTSEGVYAASGSVEETESSDHPEKCKFGRKEANPGADSCQGCSSSNGLHNDGTGLFESDFQGCPENMPIKNSKL